MRWSFYTASPPDYPRRFSLDLVADAMRKFTLTLWNIYSFFVTYANIDRFDPRSPAPPVAQRSELDRWVLSELHHLVRTVDDELAHYDMTTSARTIQAFVEDLSNWYVRRSRRRFWKSEADEDKAAAHHTLYECLVTLTKLLAPFQPFLTEEMYQNLVRSWDASAPESVHLCDYPQADTALIDEQLMAEMRTALRVVALGHAARNKAGIKVRQPLESVTIKPRSEAEVAGLQRMADLIGDELNVHQVRITLDERELVEYRLNVVPSQVGKKYKALFPAIREALAHMDVAEIAAKLRGGETVTLTVQGQEVSLTTEDVEIQMVAPDDHVLAEEAGYVVSLVTAISEELRLEGLAREIVRRIQTMRKDAGFRIEDTITTYYQADESLLPVFESWGDYIRQETLSMHLVRETPPPDAFVQTHDLDGVTITLGVRQQR